MEVLIIMFTVLICFAAASGAEGVNRTTDPNEVRALDEIAQQLGKKDWNLTVDPCTVNQTWRTPQPDRNSLINNSLICNCALPDGLCHVTTIYLKGQDLPGVLPASIVKLPFLTKIDLARNYLSGGIPREWASTKLEFISVFVNRLSGPIPDYLGNISTLTYLSLENNEFSGTVPPGLGKLAKLVTLILSRNNLTGELPMELGELTNLEELRLGDNDFTGKLPSFQNWRKLKMLDIQASGFEGPVHSSISGLYNLTELRISDLNGWISNFTFPDLQQMKSMEKLMLKSCGMSGQIPSYIANMTYLKILDLSFNNLEGRVPKMPGRRSTM